MKQTNRTLKIIIGAALGFAVAMTAAMPFAFAQDQLAAIGVLDRQYIYKASKAGSNLLANLSASLKKLDQEAQETGKKFHEEERKINADCKEISEADCKAKIEAFRQKVKAAEDDQNKRRKQLEKQRDSGEDKITKALEPILTKIIKDRKLLLVIDRGALVFAAESLDVTNEALKALDASLPKI